MESIYLVKKGNLNDLNDLPKKTKKIKGSLIRFKTFKPDLSPLRHF